MVEYRAYGQEYLIKNGYGEYHLPEWLEVFRKKKRKKKDYYYLDETYGRYKTEDDFWRMMFSLIF